MSDNKRIIDLDQFIMPTTERSMNVDEYVRNLRDNDSNYDMMRLVNLFSNQVKEHIGENLSSIILYGSYARGDYRENSDVDIMILTELQDEEIKKIETTIYDLAYDIEFEYDIHISVIIKNREQFEYWEDTLPFYRNVRNEGIVIFEK